MTTSKPRTTKPGKPPAKKQPERVRIHDLTSFAIFSLPEAARQIFGDEWYDRQVRELRDTELVLVLRGPQDVVYLRMPLLTFAGPDTRVTPEMMIGSRD